MQCADSIGFQAAAALEAYEEQLKALCKGVADPERTGSVQLHLRRVCTCCLALPQLSGAAFALLLAHHRFLAELSHSNGDASDPLTAASLHDVEECVRLLQRRCRELFIAPHLH